MSSGSWTDPYNEPWDGEGFSRRDRMREAVRRHVPGYDLDVLVAEFTKQITTALRQAVEQHRFDVGALARVTASRPGWWKRVLDGTAINMYPALALAALCGFRFDLGVPGAIKPLSVKHRVRDLTREKAMKRTDYGEANRARHASGRKRERDVLDAKRALKDQAERLASTGSGSAAGVAPGESDSARAAVSEIVAADAPRNSEMATSS